MKVYLVKNDSSTNWYEDEESIIVATDEMCAENIARLHSEDYKEAKLSVAEIDLSKEAVLLTKNTGI